MTNPITRPRRNHQDGFLMPYAYPGSGFAAAVAATGTIQCAANTAAADGDTVTISDGYTTKVYEYDKSSDGVVSGHVAFGPGTTADSISLLLQTAIEATQPAFTVVDNGTGLLTLTNNFTGAGGNHTITKSGAVASAVTSMSGGVDAVATTITSTTTLTVGKLSLDRVVRFGRVTLTLPTTLTQDASNYWTIALKDGSATLASWSTQTSAQGTITANTPVDLVLATDHDLLPNDILTVVLTKSASAAALPPGIFIIEGLDL